MTVKTTESQESFDGNGVATDFSIIFPFFQKDDLVVVLYDSDGNGTTQTLDTDYSIPGNFWVNGGQVNMTLAPALGETLIVSRIVELVQIAGFRNLGKFRAAVHEDAFDKIVMMLQQINTDNGRSVKFKQFVENRPQVDELVDNEFIIKDGGSIESSGITVQSFLDLVQDFIDLVERIDGLADIYISKAGDGMVGPLTVIDSVDAESAVPKRTIAAGIDQAINDALGILPTGDPSDYGFITAPVEEIVDLGGLI